MKNELLDTFLQRDDPGKYDFREEIMKFTSEEDALDRYAIYQAVGIAEYPKKNRGKTGFDEACDIYKNKSHINAIKVPKGEADCCELFRAVWQKLGAAEKDLTGAQLRGDTMNSVTTTLNELCKHRRLGEEFLGFHGWGKVATVFLYAHDRVRYREELSGCRGAEDFFKVAYTIGNFLPWPSGWNGPRGTGPVKDYWDLTLKCIYDWYMHNEKLLGDPLNRPWNKALAPLFGAKMVTFSDWLASFNSWKGFVETNFMQDFTKRDTAPYGPPKEFWDGHFKNFEEGHPLPPDIPEIEAFFTHAADAISKRSDRIVRELQKKDSENR